MERCYFGFDPDLGSGRHNLERARSQLALAEQVLALRDEAEALVADAFFGKD